jgi:2-polyprenyl-3-methyl-5-hydroxy-6-metoxy-1,4-benzoquinol methylase
MKNTPNDKRTHDHAKGEQREKTAEKRKNKTKQGVSPNPDDCPRFIRPAAPMVKRPNAAFGDGTPRDQSQLKEALRLGAIPGIPSAMKAQDVISTYERVGQAWAKQRNIKLMERQWLDRMLTTAPRAQGKQRVLDLGCGSGKPIGSYLAERGALMTGVDAAQTMTALYAQSVPDAEVIKADMRGLQLDRQFDAIIAWDSFFHLNAEDQRPMFATFAAHAAPRATLMFTSGHIAGEVVGEVAGAPIYHASLAPDEYRALLTESGFKVLRYTAEDPTCGDHTIWLAQYQSD